jgi:hypothetical protein
MLERLYTSLGDFPDFVRLGLMMILERAPGDDRAARHRCVEIRQESLERLSQALIVEYPHLDERHSDARNRDDCRRDDDRVKHDNSVGQPMKTGLGGGTRVCVVGPSGGARW